MIVDRYDPVNLFEMVPELGLQMEPELTRLDELLEEVHEIFNLVKADLAERYPNSERLGRRSTPVEVILRMLVVRRLYDFSYEQTEHFVSDSLVLRQFCRLYLKRAPDDTTLIRWAALIGAETLEGVNERVVELARSLKVSRGRKLRVDSTVVETNIHYPTDGSLLSDGVRVLSRLVGRAKGLLSEACQQRSEKKTKDLFRDRSRSARALARKINEAARRRGEQAKDSIRTTYRRSVKVAQASLKQAKEVRRLLEQLPSAERVSQQLEHFADLVERVVDQTRLRVLEGEQLPASEKLVSIFEEHTSIIKRGKAAKSTQFGRKVWLEEVEGGIITGYRVLEGNPKDDTQLRGSLAKHQRLFGRPPRLLAADRSVYSPANESEAKNRGVKQVALPKPGKKEPEREQYERQGWFRRARRFRAGIEGRISVGKRRGFLGRCRDRGERGFDRWVGFGVLSANLSSMARTLAAR